MWSSDGRRRLTIAHVDSLADKGEGWLSLSDLAKATEKYAQEDPDGAAKLGFGYMRYRGHLSEVFDYDGSYVSGKVCYLKYAEFDPDGAVFSFGVLPAKKVSESAPELSKKIGSAEKSYTRKQITEAIAYWEGRLKAMNEGEDDLPDDFDEEEMFIDLKDRATSGPDALAKLEAAYRALEPGWDGDMNDDGYLDWEYDFLHRALAAAVRIGSGAGAALALMKPALDRVAETGDDGNCFG